MTFGEARIWCPECNGVRVKLHDTTPTSEMRGSQQIMANRCVCMSCGHIFDVKTFKDAPLYRYSKDGGVIFFVGQIIEIAREVEQEEKEARLEEDRNISSYIR